MYYLYMCCALSHGIHVQRCGNSVYLYLRSILLLMHEHTDGIHTLKPLLCVAVSRTSTSMYVVLKMQSSSAHTE